MWRLLVETNCQVVIYETPKKTGLPQGVVGSEFGETGIHGHALMVQVGSGYKPGEPAEPHPVERKVSGE